MEQWKSTEINKFDPQNGQSRDVNIAKSADFSVHCRSTGSKIASLISQN